MKNAKELMLEFTAFSIRDPKKAAEMFAEDGAFEMPYLATFGIPSQYKGRDAIAGFFQFVRDLYPKRVRNRLTSRPQACATLHEWLSSGDLTAIL